MGETTILSNEELIYFYETKILLNEKIKELF